MNRAALTGTFQKRLHEILPIDDSPDARLLLHKILGEAGYRDTLSASSARDAFKYLDLEHAGAEAKGIDLIVMDVRMPAIDGIEACRRIKEVEALRAIPVIMMTASSQQEALRSALDAGTTDYIKKPFEEVELLTRIKAALKLKKEIDERKNWEQELTKTVSELDAALREMVTLHQQLFNQQGVALTLFRIQEARQGTSITQASIICIEHFSHKEHVPSLLLFTQEGRVAGTY